MSDLDKIEAGLAELVRKINEGQTLSAEEWAKWGELDRQRQNLGRRDFRIPRFQMKEVLQAIGVKQPTIRNWLTRKQLVLDSEADREGENWRAFSARDVLILAIAHRLSSLGFPASLLQTISINIDPWISNPGRFLVASNIPSYALFYEDGSVDGPVHGDIVSVSSARQDQFIVVRLDNLIRNALEPLGYSIVIGSGEAHHDAAERIRSHDRERDRS